MANSKQSEKRARQNLSRYKLKHAQRSRIRTAVKSVRSAIDSNNQKEALNLFKTAQKVIDSSASKKVIQCKEITNPKKEYFKNNLKSILKLLLLASM